MSQVIRNSLSTSGSRSQEVHIPSRAISRYPGFVGSKMAATDSSIGGSSPMFGKQQALPYALVPAVQNFPFGKSMGTSNKHLQNVYI